MTRDLPPEALTLVRAVAHPLRAALAALPARPVAGVVVSRDRTTVDDVVATVGALRTTAGGDRYAAVPLALARALAAELAPAVAHRLDEPLPLGSYWCVVVGPTGAGVVPVGWPTTHQRGQA